MKTLVDRDECEVVLFFPPSPSVSLTLNFTPIPALMKCEIWVGDRCVLLGSSKFPSLRPLSPPAWFPLDPAAPVG